MGTTAASTRHIRSVWQGEKPWHWKAIFVGHAQPYGYRTYRRSRFLWQLHLTPIHVARDGAKWEFGLCIGKRTIYLKTHR